jgi:hypothetical protein
MANEQALIDELSKPEYASLSDQEAADAVNAKVVTERQPVESGTLQDACMSLGVWARLEAAAETGKADPPASLARTMMQRLNANRPIDLDAPAVQTMTANMISFGLMTQEEADTMDALADASVPWTSTNGVGEVGIGLVITCRRQMALQGVANG